jgi:hypothetical protein
VVFWLPKSPPAVLLVVLFVPNALLPVPKAPAVDVGLLKENGFDCWLFCCWLLPNSVDPLPNAPLVPPEVPKRPPLDWEDEAAPKRLVVAGFGAPKRPPPPVPKPDCAGWLAPNGDDVVAG